MQRNRGKQQNGKDERFKKMSAIKETFHGRISRIKDRKSKNSQKQKRLRRDGKNTENGLNDPDNHDGMSTHLQPDIVDCKVKWALGSISINKALGCDAIPAELFKNMKNDTDKMLHSLCQQI